MTADLLAERDWLITLVVTAGKTQVNDAGYDLAHRSADFVYEIPNRGNPYRIEVTVREVTT